MVQLNCLKGRLYLQASIKNIPQINQYKISKPIFIIGLPRSGTTFLHRLLCSHPDNQGIENWLGTFPEPRPSRQQWGNNRKYLEVEAALTTYHEMNPEIKNIHEMAADKVDECRLILMHCFENVTFQAMQQSLIIKIGFIRLISLQLMNIFIVLCKLSVLMIRTKGGCLRIHHTCGPLTIYLNSFQMLQLFKFIVIH